MIKRKQQKFLKLYKPVHNRFERFCRARAIYEMPCEDLINETLLIAFKKFDTLQNEQAFLGFLIGISKRILANIGRKKQTELFDEYLLVHEISDNNNLLEQLSDTDLLYHALSYLPDTHQEALILFELTGFSIKEIAVIQNAGESAVKQRLARGRKQLSEILKKVYSFKTGGAV